MPKNNKLYLLIGVLAVLILIAYFTTRTDNKISTQDVVEKPFTVDSASIDKFEFQQRGNRIVLVKEPAGWKVTEPVSYAVTPQLVDAAVTDISKYKLESIVSSNPSKKDNFGFHDTSQVTMTVYQNGAAAGTLIIGGQGPGAGQTYVKLPDSDNIYLASNMVHSNFVKENLDEWRDKKIISIPSNSIDWIDYTYGSETFRVQKDTAANRWTIAGAVVDSMAIMTVTGQLSNFNTQTFASSAPQNSVPFAKMTVKWAQTTEFDFRKSTDSTDVHYYLTVSGNNQVFKFQQSLGNVILKSRSEFLKKE